MAASYYDFVTVVRALKDQPPYQRRCVTPDDRLYLVDLTPDDPDDVSEVNEWPFEVWTWSHKMVDAFKTCEDAQAAYPWAEWL